MGKYIVDLWLDGYDTDKEQDDACEEFIYESLNTTASRVDIERVEWKTEPPETTGNQYLYCFKNEQDKEIVLAAYYFGEMKLELSYDDEPFDGCTVDEEQDMTFCPAGWYELSYMDETSVRLPQGGVWIDMPKRS